MTSRPLANAFSAVGGRELASWGDKAVVGSGGEEIGFDPTRVAAVRATRAGGFLYFPNRAEARNSAWNPSHSDHCGATGFS